MQAQYGPEVQEIGGFWPNAAWALVNSTAVARGIAGAVKAPCASGRDDDTATVWQAWHDWHGLQCSCGALCEAKLGEAWLDACPVQSGNACAVGAGAGWAKV